MSAAVASPAVAAKPAINPWFIAAAVVVPTFMELLDTTIANVALRYIAGGLSAAETDSEWVITSYLAANAIVLTISGWLSAHLGRRNYFLLSIAVFTLASGLCGLATSLPEIILFRVIQGLAGGGLQPSSQAILLDTFPPDRQGTAMSVFGLAALVGPIVGPTLGGWLVVNYDWRWIFFINLPIGTLAFVSCYLLVKDPEPLQQERAQLKSQPLNFDVFGFGLLVLAVSSWEILLSKGQEWDWFGDPFWRIQTLAIVLVLGVVLFIWRELKVEHPLINLRVLRERNLAMSSMTLFCAFGILYAASIALPAMLQALFGYDALHAGLVLSPGGISSVSMLIVVSFLLSRGADARWLICTGLLVLSASNFWMAYLNLEVSPWQIVAPRMVLTAGLGLIFAPINVAALLYTPKHLRGSAIALVSLLRNEGGSVGTSLTQTIVQRRDQFHLSRIDEFLDPLNPHVHDYLHQAQGFLVQQTGDASAAHSIAVAGLDQLRQQQALSLAYFDIFWLAAVLALLLAPFVLFMKRSVAEKGSHVGGE